MVVNNVKYNFLKFILHPCRKKKLKDLQHVTDYDCNTTNVLPSKQHYHLGHDQLHDKHIQASSVHV